ncbi:MAG TPA: hypothetical protein VFS60_06030 [Thermoanaerobaculia bacterium]|nr:hypothetical protein [Thermoanaerobaculia bacterium]
MASEVWSTIRVLSLGLPRHHELYGPEPRVAANQLDDLRIAPRDLRRPLLLFAAERIER